MGAIGGGAPPHTPVRLPGGDADCLVLTRYAEKARVTPSMSHHRWGGLLSDAAVLELSLLL